jgi:hypothetical protein
MMAMLGIYYTDTWDAKSQPFMSTQLRSQDGKKYPSPFWKFCLRLVYGERGGKSQTDTASSLPN